MNKVFTIILALALVGTIAAIGYAIAQPAAGERFTDFYILGLGGKADQYPTELILGEEGRVVLGVVNHEQKAMSYRAEININGEKVAEIGPIILNDGEKWEQEVSFVPAGVGPNQKVEFLLYEAEGINVYRALLLWINVGLA